MTYKDTLTESMTTLARDERVRFIGYGLARGRAAGTLDGVDPRQIVETPVAENLMAGLAIGMSLRGLIPVVFYERFDFVLNALDAIVNHLDKLSLLSGCQYEPAVLFRVVVGGRVKPLFTGPTHTQDFTPALWKMVQFPVVPLVNKSLIASSWSMAHEMAMPGPKRSPQSTMLIEYKDQYAS